MSIVPPENTIPVQPIPSQLTAVLGKVSQLSHSPLAYLGLAALTTVCIFVLVLTNNIVPSQLYTALGAELLAGGVSTIPGTKA